MKWIDNLAAAKILFVISYRDSTSLVISFSLSLFLSFYSFFSLSALEWVLNKCLNIIDFWSGCVTALLKISFPRIFQTFSSVCLSLCLSVCLSVCLSDCLCLCLWFSVCSSPPFVHLSSDIISNCKLTLFLLVAIWNNDWEF
jgi:hypothetical protein